MLLLLEKLKSLLLTCLILLSIFLTYQLWFGIPPLEKGTEPRYEYAYFTHPPLPLEIIHPSEIIFFEQEDIYLYCRGEKGYHELWEKGRQLIADRLPYENLKLVSKDGRDDALQTASFKIVYNFNPPVPLEFFAAVATNLHMNIDKIIFSWDKEQADLFLEGEEIIHLSPGGDVHLDDFLPVEKKAYHLLPSLLLLDADLKEQKENSLATDDEDEEKEEIESPEPSEEQDFLLELEINVAADIYVPLEGVQGAEFLLEKEELKQEELVRAFFLDLSMARRIEERDGAIFFTNGEKGLRIYPSGMLEYTAPQLERRQSNISYSAALQKAAESQSLYGGWVLESFLYEATKNEEGYRFLWRSIKEGFLLEGKNIGSEMLINEQGVTFYRRFFYTFGEQLTERRAFRPYQEAIVQALLLNQELFNKEKKATLLSLKPVYYYQATEKNEKAVPAWCIHFAETGVIYLHWLTLEELKR